MFEVRKIKIPLLGRAVSCQDLSGLRTVGSCWHRLPLCARLGASCVSIQYLTRSFSSIYGWMYSCVCIVCSQWLQVMNPLP